MKVRDAWHVCAILMIIAGALFLLGTSAGVVLIVCGLTMLLVSILTWL